jgi:hypothetical protein
MWVFFRTVILFRQPVLLKAAAFAVYFLKRLCPLTLLGYIKAF